MNDPADGQPLRFDHQRIKRLRRLLGRRGARLEHRAFAVEGPTLVSEAVHAGWTIDSLYAPHDDTTSLEAAGALAEHATGAATVHSLARGVLERVATTETPQSPIAVVGMPDREPAAAVLADARFVVVADGVADPGNLGTILRSAEAAGAEFLVVTPGTVDHFNPKVVRASAGAIFHVPVVIADLHEVGSTPLRLIGTSSHQGVPYPEADWSGSIAVVAGNEAHGIGHDAPIDEWVRIEHRGRSESLNVAMATTVLCFHAMTTRR